MSIKRTAATGGKNNGQVYPKALILNGLYLCSGPATTTQLRTPMKANHYHAVLPPPLFPSNGDMFG
ncbi:hypothetical protein OUZ56_006998 [Daphnia magna]|uniref:Uncharacterized protein n=1 Tax=Daphnia magna TaxID=35525 RepID=A0ABQ9YXC4_9CRUS|nr:hypothetical protein OUZ56_006998 [Daphnia magna]